MNANHILRVTFSQEPDSIGWVDLNVALRTSPAANARNAPGLQASQARISNVYCAFKDLVAWMDSVARGVDPAAVEWEDEGSDVELVYESGKLGFKNREHEGWWFADIPAEVVATTFYTAFREFVRTSYDRTRYETLRRLREVFLNQLRGRQTLTDLLLPITALSGDKAADAFAICTQGHYYIRWTHDPESGLVFITCYSDRLFNSRFIRKWDEAGRNLRMKLLRRLLSSRILFTGSSASLKRLRSKRIEFRIRANSTCARAMSIDIGPTDREPAP